MGYFVDVGVYVVTHRNGSAKLADRIIVMDGGRIVDRGTNDELIARPGRYAKMWDVFGDVF